MYPDSPPTSSFAPSGVLCRYRRERHQRGMAVEGLQLPLLRTCTYACVCVRVSRVRVGISVKRFSFRLSSGCPASLRMCANVRGFLRICLCLPRHSGACGCRCGCCTLQGTPCRHPARVPRAPQREQMRRTPKARAHAGKAHFFFVVVGGCKSPFGFAGKGRWQHHDIMQWCMHTQTHTQVNSNFSLRFWALAEWRAPSLPSTPLAPLTWCGALRSMSQRRHGRRLRCVRCLFALFVHKRAQKSIPEDVASNGGDAACSVRA